jgi:hypothetical protein
MKLNALLSGLTFVLFCTVGFSQTAKTPARQKHQANQKPQVNQKYALQQQKNKPKVKAGKLTKQEAKKLKILQKNSVKNNYSAKTNHVVTKKQKAIIHQKQKVAKGRSVQKKEHNLKKKQ